jgi:DNA-binding NarL/FixJ family response regulator
MDAPVVRVLIIDDFEGWRRELRTILEEESTLRVVGEAENGREALQQAQLLRPDLVLLDIGLPLLNGIQVARLIGNSSFRSKILFVSENRRGEIAEEALRTGALGYVVKSQAGTDLLPAIDAVLQGKQFVSAVLRAQDPRETEDVSGNLALKNVVASFPPQNRASRHEVAFYPDDEGLEAGFARVSRATLNVEGTVLIIASEPHRAHIYRRLQLEGVDLEGEIRAGKYIQGDVAQTLRNLMVGDLPSPLPCAQLVSEVIRKAADTNGEHGRVTICGECAPTLLGEGKLEAALRLERIWDEVTRPYSAHTLCGYMWAAFPSRERSPLFQRICAEHSAIHGR